MLERRAHCLFLLLGKRDAQTFAHRFQRGFDVLGHADIGKPLGNHAGGVVLLPEHARTVQVLLVGNHCAMQNHLLQGFLHFLGADALFRDGNGRLGRLLSNFILVKLGHPMILIESVKREKYIGALKACRDEHNTAPMVEFFFSVAIERMKKELALKDAMNKDCNFYFK